MARPKRAAAKRSYKAESSDQEENISPEKKIKESEEQAYSSCSDISDKEFIPEKKQETSSSNESDVEIETEPAKKPKYRKPRAKRNLSPDSSEEKLRKQKTPVKSQRVEKNPNLSSASSDEDDTVDIKIKKTPIKLSSKEKNADSSSESDIESYLKPAHKIDLNSRTFLGFGEAGSSQNMRDIEKNIFSGIQQSLSDSESSDGEKIKANELISATDMSQDDTNKADSSQSSQLNFQQLEEYTLKLEEAKRSLEQYEAKKMLTADNLLDVSNILAEGEMKGLALDDEDFVSMESGSEREDWEEVEHQEVDEKPTIIPKGGVQVTLELPSNVKKKKAVDLMAVLKRKMNRIIKEKQVFVHKTHILCWIAHGNFVNKILCKETVLGLALSLIPSEKCYPNKRIDMGYLEQLVQWYRKEIIVNISKDSETGLLEEQISAQIKKKEVLSHKILVFIFICVLRSLGINCRLVVSLRVATLRPDASQLHSLSTKTDADGKKSDKGKDAKTKKDDGKKAIQKNAGKGDGKKSETTNGEKVINKKADSKKDVGKTKESKTSKTANKKAESKTTHDMKKESKSKRALDNKAKPVKSEDKDFKKVTSKSKAIKKHDNADKPKTLRKDIAEIVSKSKHKTVSSKDIDSSKLKSDTSKSKKLTTDSDAIGSGNTSSKTNPDITEHKTTKKREERSKKPNLKALQLKKPSASSNSSSDNIQQNDGCNDFSDCDDDILNTVDLIDEYMVDIDDDSDSEENWSDCSFSDGIVLTSSPIPQFDGGNDSSPVKKLPNLKKLKKSVKEKTTEGEVNTRKKSDNTPRSKNVTAIDKFSKPSTSSAGTNNNNITTNNKNAAANTKTKPKTVSVKKKTPIKTSSIFSPAHRSSMDIRGDILNLMKGRILEERQQSRDRLVKNKKHIDDGSDDDFEISPKKKEDDDDYIEKVKKVRTKVKSRVVWKGQRKEEEAKVIAEGKNLDKGGKGMDYWIEIFLEDEEKWISVDIVKKAVHCVQELYQRASHPISYILAWDNDSHIKDITKRYCPNWNTVTRKLRCDQHWLNDTLKPYAGPKTARNKEEDEDLSRQQLDQPLPTTISEYKNHPLYVLKRHLLKFEALYPPEPLILGFVRKEPVYSRQCVYILHSRDIWLKEAKVVRPGEKPYKIVKARPKYDKLSNSMITDQLLEIFGPWQVQDYDPPSAENGKIPRNAYGNVELFKECMLPKGTVHLQLPGLNKVARKLNYDCAPAMVGFDFHSGWNHPVYDGFVVCKEYADELIAAWYQEQEEAEKRAQEKIDKRVYGNWKKLINGLLIRERLKKRYDFGNFASTSKEEPKSKSKKRAIASSSEED